MSVKTPPLVSCPTDVFCSKRVKHLPITNIMSVITSRGDALTKTSIKTFILLLYYKRKALHLIGERLISNRYTSKNSVSHVLFPSTQTAYASYGRVVIIYLRERTLVPPSVQFLQESAPTIIWVSHSWGLPRSTLHVSKQASSLWHFQEVSTIS